MLPIRRSERIRRQQEAAAARSVAAEQPVERAFSDLPQPEIGSGTTDSNVAAANRPATPLLPIWPRSVSAESHRRAKSILLREYKNYQMEPLPNVTVELDDVYTWNISMPGAPGTPYEEGMFKVNIFFPSNYPTSPPKVRFVTNIFHCNISDCGSVCVDMLHDKWNPLQTVQSIILSIQVLMAEPNPHGAFKRSLGSLYMENRDLYNNHARSWTERYAKPSQALQ